MTDRDLTSFTDLAICIADQHGVMLSSSAKHAARLERRVDDVVGHSWREWTPADHLAASDRCWALALEGVPQRVFSRGVLDDGRVSTSRITMTRIRTSGGGMAILGVHSSIFVPRRLVSLPVAERPFDIPSYVATVSDELARMAAQAGLIPLADSLQAVAGQVGDLVGRCDAERLRRLN